MDVVRIYGQEAANKVCSKLRMKVIEYSMYVEQQSGENCKAGKNQLPAIISENEPAGSTKRHFGKRKNMVPYRDGGQEIKFCTTRTIEFHKWFSIGACLYY